MIIEFPTQASRPDKLTTREPAPERRRVVVLGAGAAGMTVALHVGEHSVLIEQGSQVGSISTGGTRRGGANDCKNTLPLGAARPRADRTEEGRAECTWEGASEWERQEIVGACSSGEESEDREPVVIARWIPPQQQPTQLPLQRSPKESLKALVPLLRGELRLNSRAVRVVPTEHRIDLDGGSSIIYDKLVSSISSAKLLLLLSTGLPDRVRSHQGLMYWLQARDVELVDESTQFLLGDANPFAAGRRVADSILHALTHKFRTETDAFARGDRLFKPQLVPRVRPLAVAH